MAQVTSSPSTPGSSALPDENAREIWDTGFRQKRPPGPHPSAASVRYVPLQNKSKPDRQNAGLSQAAVGFTIWRLRPPTATDGEGARILVQDLGPGVSATKLVPERIDDATPLHVGDRIRLSLEVPRAGFLYVIDRERYRDGSTGDPVLIFPALNMNHGNNEVVPGRLVEIPPQEGPVHALRITRSNDQQVGEDLMVMIAPQPLPNLKLMEGAQPLPVSQVTTWDHDWAIPSVPFNLSGGQHQVWSVAEQKAGDASSGKLLTQSDPLPQTIVGVMPQHQPKPLLVHILLDIQ